MSGGNERLRTACKAYEACVPYDCRFLADAGCSLVPRPAQYGDELGLGDAPHALARPVVFDAQVDNLWPLAQQPAGAFELGGMFNCFRYV